MKFHEVKTSGQEIKSSLFLPGVRGAYLESPTTYGWDLPMPQKPLLEKRTLVGVMELEERKSKGVRGE